MVTRAMISFDVVKNDRWYHILVPNGAPFEEACDAMRDVITMIEEQQKAEAAKVAEIVPELVQAESESSSEAAA